MVAENGQGVMRQNLPAARSGLARGSELPRVADPGPATLVAKACLGLVVALGVGGCGCGKEEGVPIVFEGGTVEGNEYQSSPVTGPWLHFPGGRRYQLIHRLGRAPTRFEAFWAFNEYPQARERESLTLATGNAAVFEEVAERGLTIHNDTCTEFFVRVVASVPVQDDR